MVLFIGDDEREIYKSKAQSIDLRKGKQALDIILCWTAAPSKDWATTGDGYDSESTTIIPNVYLERIQKSGILSTS